MAILEGSKAFGLRGVSAVMAGLCGLAGLALSLSLVVMTCGFAYTTLTLKPIAMSQVTPAGAVSATFGGGHSWSCSGRPDVCRDGPSAVSLRFMAPSLAGQLAAMAPTAALAYGLVQATLCFVGMARGRFLQRRTVSHLMRFAGGGLFFVVTGPFSGAISRWASLLTDGALRLILQEKGWSVYATSGTNLIGVQGPLMILYAVTLTVIAVVMAKASAIADDHAQIV